MARLRDSRIAVVGGAAGGLFASLLLARAGYHVVLFEQERTEPASDVEAAAQRAFRASAPQIVHPHIVMARCRQLLIERLPDVYQELLAVGVVEVPLSTHMPPTLAERSAHPGDERLTTLATRRSTLDWVLERIVREETNITVRDGVKVAGLQATPGKPPHITGVRTSDGDVGVDLVVDAAGRRSAIEKWLAEIGARPPATSWAECGMAYFTRHYRVRPDAPLPGPATSRLVVGLDEFTAGVWGADNGVLQLAVAPLATDRRFRALKRPEVHTAVLRTVPQIASWLDGLEPVSGVYQMAGLHNTMRRLVVNGAPIVTGLHAVGDSVCTTNPTLGRGLTLALSGAVDLVTTIETIGDDWVAQALTLDDLVGEHVQPFYEDQAEIDGGRLAMLRHTVECTPAPEPPPSRTDRVTYAQLRGAAMFDATAFRAFWTVQGMVRRPQEVYADPEVISAVHDTLEHHKDDPAMPQPTRDQVLAALAC